MSNKNLTILAFLAIVMVFLAVLQSHRVNKPQQGEQRASAYLIQGLNMDNVQKISAKTTTDTTILKRVQGRFFITNKGNYPTSITKLNDLITKVLDIRALEKVTSNPENFGDLGVDPNSARSVVKFMNQNDELITGVVVSGPGANGQSYVRLLPTNDVYITSGVPMLPNAPMDFIQEQVLDVQENKIESVTVSDPNGGYTLNNDPNNNKVTLGQQIPEGKKLKDSDAKTLVRALSNFRITDVMRAATADKNLQFNQVYVCRLNDSTVYTIQLARQRNESFIKCNAEFKRESRVFLEGNESEEQLKDKEQQLLAGDAALDFNNKHDGWIYKIAEYKADELTKKLDELLEDLSEEEKGPEQEISEIPQQSIDSNDV
ncbi:MAG: DUF4340 domain-containing protein [Planctomycetota bacterium]|jgi:hypothetical protein